MLGLPQRYRRRNGRLVMPLQFIDNSSIDKKTRTLIRSHVAKGKNLGRTIHRPSRYARRRQVAASTVSASEPLSNTEPEAYNDQNPESSLSIQGHIQGDLSRLFPFDTEVITYMNVAAYPPQLSRTVINATGPRLFLQYAFIDEAFAMSVTAAVSLPVTHQETTEALSHLSRSMRLVNQRLAGEQKVALSDTTLGAVIVMVQLERLLGYHRYALIHFDGLQKIIALRGGIVTLFQENPGIAQKALRADFDFALQFGSPTIYDGECVLGKDTLNWLHEKYRENRAVSSDTSAFIVCDPDLRRVYEDISMLAWLVDDNAIHGIRVDDYDFHNLLLLVGYRLLKVRLLNSSIKSVNKLELLLHLGLAALMSRFFATLGVKALDVLLLRRCIISAILEKHYDNKEEQELVLWLLLIAKTSVFRDEDEDIWLIPKVSQVTTQLGLSTWDHVSTTTRKFPWVRLFSDDMAQTLWNQIDSFP
ncbi:hypothetical protein FHL15_003196 [Xylaria flabelliformis]|uniref:Transcription factor domain-containing protein n=1 Tax=Xylaria flabelliformis TaxID=2512241 RepID=A0A553I797_9PEZI|nr:hypothetical protein FHL15_003196 [Xylaria flabelliformis]